MTNATPSPSFGSSLPPRPVTPLRSPALAGGRYPQLPQPTAKARKVRGGVKLMTKAGPVSMAWAGQRLMRLVEELAPGAVLTEGVEYGRLGQTRVLTINPGHVHARVQGRMPTAYSIDIRLPVFTFPQWEEVIGAMASEARPLAALLSGEVPPNIEDFFSPFRLHLFPSEASHVAVSCTCEKQWASHVPPSPGSHLHAAMPAPSAPQPTPAGATSSPWCKHVCCVMALLAERLGQDAFLMMALRGLNKDDLLERLRQRRAITGPRTTATTSGGSAGSGGSTPGTNGHGGPTGAGGEGEGALLAIAPDRPVPVFTPRIPGVTDQVGEPLDQMLDRFWSAGQGMDDIDLSIGTPEVTHALLRRLGSTPFPAPPAKFPLIGLLSTCYTVISERAIAEGVAPIGGPVEGSPK